MVCEFEVWLQAQMLIHPTLRFTIDDLDYYPIKMYNIPTAKTALPHIRRDTTTDTRMSFLHLKSASTAR